MQLRTLDPSDASAFHELRLAALQESPSAFASSFEEECDTPHAAIAERLAPRPDRCIIGAFEDDRLIGMVGLRREEKKKIAHRAILWGVYVAPGARKRGVGRMLMARALEQAETMPGLRHVTLGVNAASAPAMALYKAMGFRPFGVERAFLMVNGVFYDEVLMARDVGAT